jgi:iron-sulfur cluster repair protein YtfE (RIC family)
MTATQTPSLVPAHLPDFLEGIIVVHGAMRRDAARLPLAIDAVTTIAGARALQRWFVKFAREVEHHHLREDDVVWPMLVEREPAFGGSLEVLEADHHALDAAMARAVAALAVLVDDLATRAEAVAATAALGQLLADHLEREEAVMFPAMARVFTTESFTALEDALFKATPKRLIAFELPFAFDGLPAALVADKLTELPALIRVLHRWVWQPAYDRLAEPLTAVDR